MPHQIAWALIVQNANDTVRLEHNHQPLHITLPGPHAYNAPHIADTSAQTVTYANMTPGSAQALSQLASMHWSVLVRSIGVPPAPINRLPSTAKKRAQEDINAYPRLLRRVVIAELFITINV